MDIVSPEVRSRMMGGIRGKNTKPEIAVRRAAHAMGLRFRIHRRDLPGNPDLVFLKCRTVVFVHGCFWHRHDCGLAAVPKTRPEFWAARRTALPPMSRVLKLLDLATRSVMTYTRICSKSS